MEMPRPHLTRIFPVAAAALLLAATAGANASSLEVPASLPSGMLTDACVQQLTDALDVEGATPTEAFDNLAVSMADVPSDCQEARMNAAILRPAFNYLEPNLRMTAAATIPIGMCGGGPVYQGNIFDYKTRQFTLFQQSFEADADLAMATLALNEAFNEMANGALAARIAINPAGLQNLEMTPALDGSTMHLSYALPAPVFTHSQAALEDLKADSGGFVAVADGLFAPPSLEASEAFPELVLLTEQMNALFEQVSSSALTVAIGDQGLELAHAG